MHPRSDSPLVHISISRFISIEPFLFKRRLVQGHVEKIKLFVVIKVLFRPDLDPLRDKLILIFVFSYVPTLI